MKTVILDMDAQVKCAAWLLTTLDGKAPLSANELLYLACEEGFDAGILFPTLRILTDLEEVIVTRDTRGLFRWHRGLGRPFTFLQAAARKRPFRYCDSDKELSCDF